MVFLYSWFSSRMLKNLSWMYLPSNHQSPSRVYVARNSSGSSTGKIILD